MPKWFYGNCPGDERQLKFPVATIKSSTLNDSFYAIDITSSRVFFFSFALAIR